MDAVVKQLDSPVVGAVVDHTEGLSKGKITHHVKAIPVKPLANIYRLAFLRSDLLDKPLAMHQDPLLIPSQCFVTKGGTPCSSPLIMQRLHAQRLQGDHGSRQIVPGCLYALGSLAVYGHHSFWVADREIRRTYSDKVTMLFMQLLELSKSI